MERTGIAERGRCVTGPAAIPEKADRGHWANYGRFIFDIVDYSKKYISHPAYLDASCR